MVAVIAGASPPAGLIHVLADDLTGALDSAVRFAGPAGIRATWDAAPGCAASAHCIDVRDGAETTAAQATRSAAAWLGDAGVALLKCDSRLRGHVAAQAMAACDALGPRRVVIAPAVPEQGRVAQGGRVWTRCGGGWSVEPRVLADDFAARGTTLALCAAGDPAPPGVSLWDAGSEADLDAIVAATAAAERRDGGRTLWCGASGLAAALARHLGASAAQPAPPTGPALVLIGTAHPATLAQTAKLGAAATVDRNGAGADAVAARLSRGLSAAAVALVRRPDNPALSRAAVAAAMAHVVDRAPRPGCLVVSGGATLLDVLSHLRVACLVVDGDYAPGAPASRLVGGPWDGLRLISKSGGFGDPSFFATLRDECDAPASAGTSGGVARSRSAITVASESNGGSK